MNKNSSLMGPLLHDFFLCFLGTQKRSSPQTVRSYRDTFRLLLQYVHEKHGIPPESLRVQDVTVSVILSFLDYLEKNRENSIRSRNLRLSAIRSFFRLVALRDPISVEQAARVLAIPVKRTNHRLVRSLSRAEIDAIIAAPERKTWSGRRDYALLLTLYNSGARASEITALKRSQVSFSATTFLHLYGKGRKERTVPLWKHTAKTLRDWFDESIGFNTDLAFPSASKKQLTRDGLNYILQKSVTRAAVSCASLRDKTVTPHMIRHSTASHLLQSGVDLAVIALWLGHESVKTTHIYLESDLKTKENALSKLAPAGGDVHRFRADDKVLAFLASL